MSKKWYVKSGQQELGPFSIDEILEKVKVTPLTLVRKEGQEQWQAIRDVPILLKALQRWQRQKSKPSSIFPPQDGPLVNPDHEGDVLVEQGNKSGGPEDNWFFLLIILITVFAIIYMQRYFGD